MKIINNNFSNQLEKWLRRCFFFSLACLILFGVVSEIYFFIVNLYETMFISYLIWKGLTIFVIEIWKGILDDMLSYFFIHVEEFFRDPLWYLKVRSINVHRINKPLYKLIANYFEWLRQFEWYRSWGNFLLYLLNQGLDYWLHYLSWLINLKKIVGPLIFVLGWFILYGLVLYFFDKIIKNTSKSKKK